MAQKVRKGKGAGRILNRPTLLINYSPGNQKHPLGSGVPGKDILARGMLPNVSLSQVGKGSISDLLMKLSEQ